MTKLQGAGLSRRDVSVFTTETLSDVAPDALLTLLYARHSGAKNIFITERADSERKKWFKELFLMKKKGSQTLWMSADFAPQE